MNLLMIDDVRNCKPLIHHITNYVTVNECANITLNLGALPVMAHAPEEVAEMVTMAGSLVLNIGTLSKNLIQSMIIAGKKAVSLGIPVVLDPVGAGATKLRTESCLEIMKEVPVAAIKGNAAEISILAGVDAKILGVESMGVSHDMVDVARRFASQRNCVIAVSGASDIVTDGKETYMVDNGHRLMGELVGTGCMAASALGAFLALGEKPVESAAVALISFEIAAELACERADVRGPGSFFPALMDEARMLKGSTVAERSRIRKIPSPAVR